MKPKIRLFPLDAESVALSAILNEKGSRDERLVLSTSTYSGGLNSSHRSKFCKDSSIPQILDNGYFFSEESWLDKNSNTVRRYFIENILSADGTLELIKTQQELDTSMIAALRLASSQHLIVGVNKNHDELFLFTLIPSRGYVHISSGVSRPRDAYALDKDTPQSVTIFTAQQSKIQAIVGFPQLPIPTFAVVTESGEIILGKMTGDHQLNAVSLHTHDSKPCKPLTIFSTPRGLLIAHDPNKNTLKIWDIHNNNLLLGEHACPQMHHLSISVDGNFLTAIDGENESNVVHCFELNHFKRKWLILDNPIEDFVIGKNRQVCLAHYEDPALQEAKEIDLFSMLEQFGTRSDLGWKRAYLGTIDQLLLAQEQKPEVKEERTLLSRMSSLFKSSQSNTKNNTLNLNDDEDLSFLDATP